VWGVRADAELPEILLYASSFPLGFPGRDNHIAYGSDSVQLQASTARAYDKTNYRLYGGVSDVHPSRTASNNAELRLTVWSRANQRPDGALVNLQSIDHGVDQLPHGEQEVKQRLLNEQHFAGVNYLHEGVGSARLEGDRRPLASADHEFLYLSGLLPGEERMHIPRKMGANNETTFTARRKRKMIYLTNDSTHSMKVDSSSYHEAPRLLYMNRYNRSKQAITKTTAPIKIIVARTDNSQPKHPDSKIQNIVDYENKARYASIEDTKRLITTGITPSNA
jgi:hypothetical protein